MIATHIRTKTLTVEEYNDLKIRARVEQEVAEQLSPLCDRYSISWANCILLDPTVEWDEQDGYENMPLTRGKRCVGRGKGEIGET